MSHFIGFKNLKEKISFDYLGDFNPSLLYEILKSAVKVDEDVYEYIEDNIKFVIYLEDDEIVDFSIHYIGRNTDIIVHETYSLEDEDSDEVGLISIGNSNNVIPCHIMGTEEIEDGVKTNANLTFFLLKAIVNKDEYNLEDEFSLLNIYNYAMDEEDELASDDVAMQTFDNVHDRKIIPYCNVNSYSDVKNGVPYDDQFLCVVFGEIVGVNREEKILHVDTKEGVILMMASDDIDFDGLENGLFIGGICMLSVDLNNKYN